MKITLRDLRHHAIASSLFPPTTLGRAISRLGFVQADPIRAPARAQDLILRHRVKGYRAGDLDRQYRALRLEEDFLYAYGFMPVSTWQLLHPRGHRALSQTEQQVLKFVAGRRRLHPRELEAQLGKQREVNAWGGYSKATTRALERLHFLGLLRIGGRKNGVKLYELAAAITHPPMPDQQRMHRLVLLIAKILAPLSERSLRSMVGFLRYAAPGLPGRKNAVNELLKASSLDHCEIDGVRYVWPHGPLTRREPKDAVRFLAPFDPIVWDRRRFEHFWGWPYRFEAYTPPGKRKMGYYALPLLWRADVIGWVNVADRNVIPGFIHGSPPVEPAFQRAFDEEVERLRYFLG